MSQHLLPCDCGNSLVVRTQQAGESIVCDCGKTIEAPGLRRLRELPAADDEKDSSKIYWTRTRGVVFAFGFGTFAIGVGLLGLFGLKLSQLHTEPPPAEVVKRIQGDLSRITPLDAWKIWSAWEETMLYRDRAPVYLQNRARVVWLKKLIAAASVVAVIGMGIALGAIFGRPSDGPSQRAGTEARAP